MLFECNLYRYGVGFGREATNWLTARGVRLVGTDAWSWDAPFAYTAERFKATGDASIVWEGHKAGAVQVESRRPVA